MVELQNPVIDELKKRVKKLGSQKAVAEQIGISEQFLSDVMNSKRNLGDDVLDRIGFDKVIVHVRKGSVQAVVNAISAAQSEAEHLDGIKERVFEPKMKQVKQTR